MIIEITNLDIHTAERVVEALELADYQVEIVQCNNELYRIGFTSAHDKRYGHKLKLRYYCSKHEGWYINGVIDGVAVTRQHYKGMGVMNTFKYQEERKPVTTGDLYCVRCRGYLTPRDTGEGLFVLGIGPLCLNCFKHVEEIANASIQ